MPLAVLGAQPYFQTAQHVGGPIVEKETQERFHKIADEAFRLNYFTNGGPLSMQLEREVASIHGVAEAVVVANGFLAQTVLLNCMEIEPGEAIVSSNTFVATAHACETCGFKTVFADINPDTLNLDPDAVERLITDKTRLIAPTHLFGVLADMPRFVDMCAKRGVHLIADAAQAFDCDQKGARPGEFGVPEFLSFHATKYFSTFEGGAILTNDPDLAAKARSLRNFGFWGPNDAEYLGINAKMSEIAAAFGLASLPALRERRESLRQVRETYINRLAALPGIRIHPVDKGGRNNYRYFALFVEDEFPLNRDEVDQVLRLENILPRSYFHPGCSNMGFYRGRKHNALPETDKALAKILCLPTSFVNAEPAPSAHAIADMFEEMVEKADAVKKALPPIE